MLESGAAGRAAVPSGASTGEHEALELRDGEPKRYLGKGVLEGGRERERDDRARARRAWTRSTRCAIDGALIELDGTDEQGAARRERDPRACRWRRRRPRPHAVGLPLYRYLGGADARAPAGAADERPQRRRARRQQRRHPGVHDRAGRRADRSPRRCAWASRSFHALRERAARARARRPPSATRAASRPNLAINEEALDVLLEAIERGRLQAAARRSALALDVAASELLRERRATCSRPRRSRSATPRAMVELLRATGATRYPIVSIEDGLAEDDWDGLGAADRRRSATACSSSATTCSSRTRAPARAGHRGGRRELDPRQGEPDRHADRDARLRCAWRSACRLHRRHLAPLAARPRTRRSPTSRWPRTPGRSRPDRSSRTDRVAKYNQLLRIEEQLGNAARFAGPRCVLSFAGGGVLAVE